MRLRRSNFWTTSTFKKIRSLGSTEKLENKKQAGALDVSVDPRESRAVPALDFPVASFVGLSPGGPVPGSAALQPAVPVTERVLGLAGSESRWSVRRINRPVLRHRAGTPAGDEHGKSRSHFLALDFLEAGPTRRAVDPFRIRRAPTGGACCRTRAWLGWLGEPVVGEAD